MKKKFEEGKIYGKTNEIYSLSRDIAPSVWIRHAYLVKKRTAKYITVEDVTPFSMNKGKVLRFYVYSLETEPYIPHEYIALNSYGKTHVSDQISSLDELDRKLLEEDNPDEHSAVYEPESYEEKYSDFCSDNRVPEQDIPMERGSEVDVEEHEGQQRSPAMLENFYGYTCLHDIVAEQRNLALVAQSKTPSELERLLRTGNKSTLWFICSKTGAIRKELHTRIYFSTHDKEHLIRLCMSKKYPDLFDVPILPQVESIQNGGKGHV